MPEPYRLPRWASISAGMSLQWTCLMRDPNVLT